MKIVSPLVVVALATAVLAPGTDAGTCAQNCDAAGCSTTPQLISVVAGKFDIPATGVTCASSSQKKFIKTLKVSEKDGLGIAVSFAHGTTTFSTQPTQTDRAQASTPVQNEYCYYTYGDVGASGITLTGDVVPTVTCTTSANPCNIKYSAEFGCIPSACSKSPDGSSTLPSIAAGASADIPIPAGAPATCIYGTKRYISALEVSEDAGLPITVTFKRGSSTNVPVTTTITKEKDNGDPKVNYCYYSYTDVGKDVDLDTDVIATVSCPAGGAACSVKYKATYACSTRVVSCPADVTTGLTAQTVSTAAGFDIKKTNTCGAGRFNYLTSLDVRGDVAITFNNQLTTKPTSSPTTPPLLSGSTCSYYKDVLGKKSTATDMVATVKCGTLPCTINYAATWNCSAPIVYTRTETSTGADCVKDLTDCANRCAKSYQLVTTYNAATTNPDVAAFTSMALKSQIKATGCTCDDVTAKFTDPTAANPAATATDLSVQFAEAPADPNTMTLVYTGTGKVCTSIFKRASYENKFIEKPYTRTTPGAPTGCTPDAATASSADICAFKCAAEIALTKPTADSIRVTKAAVAGCDCGAPVDLVVDGDGATAGTDALKYAYDKATGVLTVTTTTGADDTKLVCPALYKESCSKFCTDGACGINDIPAAGLSLKNLDGCPAYTFSYPKSVIVRGLLAENEVSVKSATAVVDKTAVKCYKTYGQLGGTLTSINADFTPTVACGTDGCKAAVKTEWGCTPVKCLAAGADFSTKVTMTVPNATGMVVPGPTTACGTGLKAYIKTLDIRTAAGKDVVVKFNNGLTPAPSSKGATCTFYSNVISPTASTDVSATINCASATAADTCDVQYKVEYGCFKPAAATVYTRKGAPEGRGCVTDLSTCASRCAKSYQLIATETEKMLVPQISPDGCYCPALTATTDATTTTKATNTATTMEVNDGTTMTVEYTAPGKECKTTFAKAAFANSFVAETYARGTVTPATCTPAADADAATICAYKCAAELSIKPLGGDALNVTQAVVTSPADCTCDPFMAYVDVDGLTASGPLKTSSVEIKQTTGALTVKTTTGSTVCTASYSKKTAPPPPATTTPSPTTTAPPPATTAKTGTSAGVSALGAGADAGMVTVTLVAAAAGVQAVGLPA